MVRDFWNYGTIGTIGTLDPLELWNPYAPL